MNLGELREMLSTFKHLPDHTPIILQKDAEGNSYSPLVGAEEGRYEAETTYSGQGYPVDYAPEGAAPAVFLWPVN